MNRCRYSNSRADHVSRIWPVPEVRRSRSQSCVMYQQEHLCYWQRMDAWMLISIKLIIVESNACQTMHCDDHVSFFLIFGFGSHCVAGTANNNCTNTNHNYHHFCTMNMLIASGNIYWCVVLKILVISFLTNDLFLVCYNRSSMVTSLISML